MFSAPKISVIVPVYNAEKWLQRCVDSILAQTFTDFELLLIDDGSTDASGEICDEYVQKDSRIRAFHKENGGASSARNVGLDNIRGKWVTFCDADDCVTIEWLSIFNTIGECDLKAQGINTDKPLSSNKSLTSAFNYNGDIAGFLNLAYTNRLVGYLVCKLFKTSIIKNNNLRFDESVRFLEDELFVVNYLTYCKKAISVNKASYYYFVPEWSKYGKEIGADKKHRAIISAINYINGGKETDFCKYHVALLVQCLIQEFLRTNDFNYLEELSKIHINNIHASELNTITKWVLIKDKKLFFASFLIRIAHFIGNIKRKISS